MTPASRIDFEGLFAKSPNPYVVVDRDLVITWMNEAYLAATMRQRDQIIGRPMFEAFPSDPASESFRLLQHSLHQVVETGQPDEIALIRYDLSRPDGSVAELYWSATHTPLLDEAGRTQFVLQHTVDVTELHGLRRLRDEQGLVDRAGAVQAENRNLRRESDYLKKLVEQAPGFVAVLTEPQHIFRMVNAAYSRLVGDRDVIGKPVVEALPEVVGQGFVELLDRVRAEGKPYFGEREELLLANEVSGGLERRYLNFIYQPIFDQGTVSGIFVQGHDVTEEVRAAEAQLLLVNELNHRVKNTLAVVQGLAAQSFRHLEGAEAARETFDARLNALAAAHSLLTANSWEPAPIGSVIETATEAAAGADLARFAFNGPDIALHPQVAVSLAMIVHELSTNAIKYGALSNSAGEIDVSWSLRVEDEVRSLTLDWRERGGPTVAIPERRGFGTRLIERGLSSEGGNSVSMDYRPDGLHCRIVTILEPA